ncbi:MAG: malto-oligosyltrehalose synthase [Bacteroidetes bacterium]|jgi:malto-oligosyltrehalose synthase/4-alpha-glucanotransferase|nr:malto-oligosyltrehalose synthase [Bacteroidota bacterium]
MAYNPVSTYRIQFSKDFTFNDLLSILDYLHELGIKTIYASPVFESEPGSTHGYNVINPHRINPEIGTYQQFEILQKELKKRSMGWLQDIVPNHMSYSANNPWIADIFERGAHSSYYHYFDILWNHPDPSLPGKVLLPVLGSLPDQAILNKEINLEYQNKSFVLTYFDQHFPADVLSYNNILRALPVDELPPELDGLLKKMFKSLNQLSSWENLKNELYQLYTESEKVKKYIDGCVENINENARKFRNIIDIQVFKPAYWKTTRRLINYRRFFTVNDLISLNMQTGTVFNDYHSFLFELMEKDFIQGLRIDHVDGLFEPQAYLARLRENIGLDRYLVVEKILEHNERLEATWPVQGTTGYDFLALVNNLLTNEHSEVQLNKTYDEFRVGTKRAYDELVYRKKAFILKEHMAGDLDNLYHTFNKLLQDIHTKLKPEKLKQALYEFLLASPVYRIYKDGEYLSKPQEKLLKETFSRALDRNSNLKKELKFLRTIFLDTKNKYADYRPEIDAIFNRCMQYAGPLMAKGVEDTAFYTFNRYIVHNEVGDSPSYFGVTIEDFHTEMKHNYHVSPLSMNTTSTHDTKRGEDARARLNVLADMPEEWGKKVNEWHQLNEPLKNKNKGRVIPSSNDEYFIYQAILGALPMDGKPTEDFKRRLNEYLVKVLREAKMESSWADPDEYYEQYTLSFAQRIIDDDHKFLKSLGNFHKKLNYYGIINSLNQVILKLTCTGTPDIYQGSEHWNFSFVDPDNRRPIDYAGLSKELDKLKKEANTSGDFLNNLWKNATDGSIKMWLHYKLLNERRLNPELFAKGEYIPLTVKGKFKDFVLAYARHYKNNWIIVVLPLHLGHFHQEKGKSAIQKFNWKNTTIHLPDFGPEIWQDIMDKNNQIEVKKKISVSKLLTNLPFGIYVSQKEPFDRHAGILAHITSLPGKYPSGDFGTEAYRFVDFLERCHQKYWQILPLNQTVEESAFSPYSSVSAFAGNTLLINMDKLVEQQLLTKKDLPQQLDIYEKSDFKETKRIKQPLLDKAYKNFIEAENHPLKIKFEEFCKKEKYWLDDYALFLIMRESFNKAPWNTWPEQYRFRDPIALRKFSRDYKNNLDKEKFFQFLFFEQWHALKQYANNKDIQLFGDIPIYLSYDSADVWAHPQYFRLDENMDMTHVAGVPPDYFNDEGQFWGMPVFVWETLKKNGYEWWIRRLRKNLEMVDLLRIDHFRAFADYWEIPANATSAKEGEWKEGPGEEFFRTLQKAFPSMPFVAEDLGDIGESVYTLRDKFELPGMSVLQFGFGKDKAKSVHAPNNHKYNSVVYTGTHDNNTVQGWYKMEADKQTLKKLAVDAPKKIKEKNIHNTFILMAYQSVAKIAIIPIQDFLGLGTEARMNIPSTDKCNWQFRIPKNALARHLENRIKKWMKANGRGL